MTSSHDAVSQVFLEFLEKIRIKPFNDKFEALGKPLLLAKLNYFVANNLPIQLLLPGFPFRAANTRSKVLSHLPDQGEELALTLLEEFCCALEDVYSAGVEFIIFSDGRVYNDILNVPLPKVSEYREAVVDLAREVKCHHLTFHSLEDHFASTESKDGVISQLLQFLPGESIDTIIDNNKNFSTTCDGFTKLVLQEHDHQISVEQAKELALKLMTRNIAYTAFLRQKYPKAIRFSIHQHDNSEDKIGIHVIPPTDQTQAPKTPWHHVVVQNASTFDYDLVPLKEIDLQHHQVIYKYGRKWGFKSLV